MDPFLFPDVFFSKVDPDVFAQGIGFVVDIRLERWVYGGEGPDGFSDRASAQLNFGLFSGEAAEGRGNEDGYHSCSIKSLKLKVKSEWCASTCLTHPCATAQQP